MKLTSHQHEDHVASRAVWFALGLLSGAAVALLTSPQSGRENRQILRRRARQVADTVAEQGVAFVDGQAEQLTKVAHRRWADVEAFGSRVNDAVEHGKIAYRTTKERFESSASNINDVGPQASSDAAGRRPTT